jgi:hypothetical protein
MYKILTATIFTIHTRETETLSLKNDKNQFTDYIKISSPHQQW